MASFGAAALGALVAAFAPLGQRCTATLPADADTGVGVAAESCRGISVYSMDGAWILVVVSVPVLVALFGILVDRRPAQIVSAVLLWIGCVLALASVGLFFVPAAVLMTVAAARPHEAVHPRSGQVRRDSRIRLR